MRPSRLSSRQRRAFLSAAAASTALFVEPSLLSGTQANSALAIGLIGNGRAEDIRRWGAPCQRCELWNCYMRQ